METKKKFNKGDKVQILIGSETVNGTFSHIAKNGKAYVHVTIQGTTKGYERVEDKVWKIGDAASDFKVEGNIAGLATPAVNGKDFDINKRFEFFGSLIRMVIKGQRVSLVVTGEGGLGKSYQVKEELLKKGLTEVKEDGFGDYVIVKGFATAKGLYNTLWEHREKLIIFDDCDEILKNDVAKNILKGALDSYDERVVSWISQSFSSDVPASFTFEGQIIFISNMSKNNIDQAIKSRATNLDLTMSIDDKLSRMDFIMNNPNFKAHVKPEIKTEAYELLKKHAHACSNLNMRTLIEIIDFRTSGEENWEELAEYVIYAS